MLTILVKPQTDASQTPINYWIGKYTIDPTNHKLDASMVNLEALNLLKDRLLTYDRVKSMKKVKKFNFEATTSDDKLLITFTGNIRDSLFFLNEFGAISPKACQDGIAILESISYKFPKIKIATDKDNNEEEKQQPTSSKPNNTLFFTKIIETDKSNIPTTKIIETNKTIDHSHNMK